MISPLVWLETLEKVTVDFIRKILLKLRFNLIMKNQLGYHSKPYWQYKSTCQINSIVSGGDNYENHRRSHPKR